MRLAQAVPRRPLHLRGCDTRTEPAGLRAPVDVLPDPPEFGATLSVAVSMAGLYRQRNRFLSEAIFTFVPSDFTSRNVQEMNRLRVTRRVWAPSTLYRLPDLNDAVVPVKT